MKQVFVSFALLLFYATSFGQDYFKKRDLAPTSPEAASLEKFVSYPVNMATGVPTISVPIYTMELRGFKLPLAASYHASGVRVEDIAGSIGLGWSLSSGGVISIQVNGILDELAAGFNHLHPRYNQVKNLSLVESYGAFPVDCSSLQAVEDPLYLYSGGDIEYLRNIHFGIDDSEPDMYNYSFGGSSGKFFQDEDGVFRTIPFTKNKIERVYASGNIVGYRITDEDGNRFDFFQREESQSNSFNLCSPNPFSISQQGFTRSYYLTKVVTPLLDSLVFVYSSNGFVSTTQSDFSRARVLFPNSPCSNGNFSQNIYNCQINTVSNTATVKLDKIISSRGEYADFIYSSANRQDLPSKALDRIEIRSDYGGRLLKSVDFNKDYWSGRLRLTGIVENGKPGYLFDYDNTGLPPRESPSQDHWGYFNGASNTSLSPLDEFNGFRTGGNREPNELFIQAGILKKITYPTGGFTEYIYEMNDFFVPYTTTSFVKQVGATLASFPNQTVSTQFTVPANSTKHIFSYNNTFSTNLHNDYCYIRIYGPNGFFLQLVGANDYQMVNLPAGTYTLEIENVGSTYSAAIDIYWFNNISIPPHTRKGGGLRVKEVRTSDGVTNVAVVQRYEYQLPGSNNSSGVGMYEPVYNEIQDEERLIPVNDCWTNPGVVSCQFIVQNARSRTPLGFSGGYHVAYSNVTVYTSSKEKSGYSVYKYIATSDNSINAAPSPPYPPQVNYDWVNGSLLQQEDYRYNGSGYEMIRKLSNTYNYENFDRNLILPNTYTAHGAKIALLRPPRSSGRCIDCANDVLSSISFGIAKTRFFSSWHYLTKTEETMYEGGVSATKVVDYFYDNPAHAKPSRIVTFASNGDRLTTRIKYPLDYGLVTGNDDLSAGVRLLQTRNMIGSEIEKTIIRSDGNGSNPRVLNSSLSIYGASLPVLEKVRALETNTGLTDFVESGTSAGIVTSDNRYKDQGMFVYGADRNIIQQSKTHDVPEAYVWGYGGRHLVASVKGIASSSLPAVNLSPAILNDPQDADVLQLELNKIRTAYPNAMVTTYSWIPSVGVSRIVDPRNDRKSFEYDALGRVVLIRDSRGNVLKKFCYTYTGQVENCNSNVFSSTRSGTFVKQCNNGGIGSSHVYTVTKTSTVSQAAADASADADVAANGQNFANANGTCSWTSDAITGLYYSQNCQAGQTANPYSVNIPAGAHSSTISKADANAKAQAAAQALANQNGTCSGGSIVVNYANYSGATGWNVALTNTVSGQVYNFQISGLNDALGSVPAGNYNISITHPSQQGNWFWFEICSNYASGSQGVFYNIAISSSCNLITISL